MPHPVIPCTPNLKRETDMTALCRSLADTLLGVHNDQDRQVFPAGGTRVQAYPAAHHAVADGRQDYAFVQVFDARHGNLHPLFNNS